MGDVDSRFEEIKRRKAAGEHLAVIRLAAQVLGQPDGITDMEGIEAARMGATAALSMRLVYQAARFADTEREWADNLDNPVLQAVAAYHQGTAWLEIGDTHTALEHLTTFSRLDVPHCSELDRYRGAVWFNIGTAKLQRRDFTGASEAFQAARDAYLLHGSPQQVIRCHLQEAWSDLMAEQYDMAGSRLGQARALIADHPDDETQTTAIIYWALYELRTGHPAQALSKCEEVLTPGRRGLMKHHTTDAAWVAGECALQLGHIREAGMFADLALQVATEGTLSSAMGRANNLRQRVQARLGESA